MYDLKDRFQIPGYAHVRQGFKRPQYPTGSDDGQGAHWEGIYDDNGRIMIAISYNSDIGDAWEYADAPEYPADMTTLAYRYGINYIMYAITH